ncbi:MAG TPA: enoyl-CoA hydratase-related protein [Sporichthya sp.]|nr:enoyl-CoA hydratase-related protein [Sporichthya sp.]
MPDSPSQGSPEELVRQLYDAITSGDTDAFTRLLHPEFRGVLAEGMPAGAGHHDGPGAMWEDGWKQIGRVFAAGPKPAEMTALVDGRLLVSGRYSGHGRRGGAPLDAVYTHVFSFRDGRISGIEQVSDTARWRDAASPFRTMTLDITDGLATVTLTRPELGNAWDVAMTDDILELATRLSREPGLRCVLLRAEGAFTVGGNIDFLGPQNAAERASTLHRMIGDYHAALERLASLDAPLVAAVGGSAGGGGLGLVCAADIAIAADDAAFALGYAALGMTSDGANTWYLPRLIGLRRAQQMFLLNKRLTAAEALEWGLVTEVVPAGEVDARAAAVAAKIAAGPTRAFAAMRRLLRNSYDSSLRDQLAAELREVDEIARTDDIGEGMSAFAARRRPEFRGH